MNQTAQRLDALIDRRRLDCGLRWKDVATEVGVTPQTLLEARKGKQLSDLTSAGIERFMGWAPGSVRRVLNGDDPLAAPEEDAEPSTAPPLEYWEHELTAPEGPLRGEEILRWRQVERGREYRLSDGDISVDYTFGAEESPEEVIDDLRGLLEPHRVAVEMMERRRARR